MNHCSKFGVLTHIIICNDTAAFVTSAAGARIPSFLIDTCGGFFITPEIEQELERVFCSIAEADDGLQ